jgi:hypothetical protein
VGAGEQADQPAGQRAVDQQRAVPGGLLDGLHRGGRDARAGPSQDRPLDPLPGRGVGIAQPPLQAGADLHRVTVRPAQQESQVAGQGVEDGARGLEQPGVDGAVRDRAGKRPEASCPAALATAPTASFSTPPAPGEGSR